MIADTIGKLLVLQDRDRRLRAIGIELAAAPHEREAIESSLASATQAVNTAKTTLQSLEMERKKLEIDAGTKRDSINRFKTQQQQTRKNEEYQALVHEIDRFNKDISAIEDEELEVMERIEAARTSLAQAESRAAQAKAEAASHLAVIDSKTATLQQDQTAIEADRVQLVLDEDEDLLEIYNRLMKNKGDAAVVGLEHDSCTGCHMKVTATISHKVRAGKEICHCQNCGRILYWED